MSDPSHPDPAAGPGQDDRAYLLRRAEDHRRMAAIAEDPGSRAIHLRFREMYLLRATYCRGTSGPSGSANIPGTSILPDG